METDWKEIKRESNKIQRKKPGGIDCFMVLFAFLQLSPASYHSSYLLSCPHTVGLTCIYFWNITRHGRKRWLVGVKKEGWIY